MKKLFILAVAAIAVSSCTNKEVVDVPEGNTIGFSTFVGKSTRADVTTENITEMYVYGQHGDVTDFDGGTTAKVTKENGTWTYSPLRYWVAGESYYFAATAPIVSGATYTNGSLSFAYTVTDGETDLVTAANAVVTALASGNNAVDFTFKHALSKVQFTFNSEWDKNSEVTVSDVTLSGVQNAGTITTTANSTQNWTATSGNATYSYASPTIPVNENNAVSVAAEAIVKYLLPQTLTADAITLTFTVTVETKGVDEPKTKTRSVRLPVEPVSAWDAGNVYNYSLTINAANVFEEQPIEFGTVTVDVWGNLTGAGNLTPDEGVYDDAQD